MPKKRPPRWRIIETIHEAASHTPMVSRSIQGEVTEESMKALLGLPNPLNETEQKVADFISANPGCSGKEIAAKVNISEEHFRRIFSKRLKPKGFYNEKGYRPPVKRRA
jgi:hypothetical protein